MFPFKSDLHRRVEAIERKLAVFEQKERCAKGDHRWVMRENSPWGAPYIQCSECWAQPPKGDGQ